jgi:iron uptake system component EfeO
MRRIMFPYVGLFALTAVATYAAPSHAAEAPTTIAAPATAVSPLELADPVARYKLYVIGEVADLVRKTRVFTDAVKAGNLTKARALYSATRVPYERIEPIAELFDDLDKSIDSRVDDHGDKPEDPGFTGFHRIEYGLFQKNSTDGLAPFATKLLADVQELQTRIRGLTFPPEKVIAGAAALIEEVASTKISGEENRYGHTDLSDFDANITGAKKIVELFRALLQRTDATQLARIEADFARIDTILARYRLKDGGFQNYEKLTQADRNGLQAPITTLAEELSTLRGVLGMG